MVSQLGTISGGQLLQAKGIRYSLTSLVLDSRAQTTFDGGWFATIYLAPSDYHRVHVPIDGTLRAFRCGTGRTVLGQREDGRRASSSCSVATNDW